MPSGLLRVPGAELWVETAGAGPPVILIHGFTLDSRLWEAVIGPLSAGHTVVAYDVRGFGRSSVPREPYAHRDDLRALLDAKKLDRVALVGHSVGSHQALEFALAYPDRVERLALVGPSVLAGVPFPPDINAAFAAMAEEGKKGSVEAAKAIWREVGWFLPARERPEVAASLDAMLQSYSGWHFSNQNPAIPLEPPPGDRLAEIRVPALIVVGERDLPYNHEIAGRLEQQIPDARKVVLPGIGHMVPMEAPDALSAELKRFLELTTPRGP
jgi:3-oxoadipate enol-lactonase